MAKKKNNALTATITESWDGLTKGEKAAAGVLGTIDVAAKAIALRDLARTKQENLRGPKWAWGPIIGAVNTFGWLGYYVFGKKR